MLLSSFLESFIATLGGAGIAVAALAFLSRSLVSNWFQKDLEVYRSTLKRNEWQYEHDQDRLEKLNVTLNHYSGVLLLAATDLQDRLWHLCQRQSGSEKPVLRAEDPDKPMYASWPMTRRHYAASTFFLFGQYFCWVEIIKSKVRHLDFGDDRNTNAFQYYLKRIERALAETDLQKLSGSRIIIMSDWPFFQMFQTEIGTSMITDNGSGPDCVDFHKFQLNLEERIKNSQAIIALENLLTGAMSNEESNFCLTRLRLVSNALVDLIRFLGEKRRLLQVEAAEYIDIPDFNLDAYAKKWPAVFDKVATSAIGSA